MNGRLLWRVVKWSRIFPRTVTRSSYSQRRAILFLPSQFRPSPWSKLLRDEPMAIVTSIGFNYCHVDKDFTGSIGIYRWNNWRSCQLDTSWSRVKMRSIKKRISCRKTTRIGNYSEFCFLIRITKKQKLTVRTLLGFGRTFSFKILITVQRLARKIHSK